jgi:elongation factor G
VPRIAFVNKLDRIGANFERCVEMMEQRLGARTVPMQLPLGLEDSFVGIVDLVSQQAVIWDDASQGAVYRQDEIPEQLREEVETARDALFEIAADFDEDLMEKYLEGGEMNPDSVRQAIRVGTLKNEIVPVFCGAALRNKGVQPVLDAVVDYLPSPDDLPPIVGTEPTKEKEITRKASVKEPFSALAFKVQNDSYSGQLTYFRVYSGQIESGKTAYNPLKNKRERIGRLLQMHANKREEVKTATAGDIVAAVGLRFTNTGDTLCDQKHPILLESILAPEPVISIAIEPKTMADQEKLSSALERMAHEDPTFVIKMDEETGQTLIKGMGELHLEIIIDRIRREFNVEANVGDPRVAFRETVTVANEAEGTFDKQIAGKANRVSVVLRVGPGERGSGVVFHNATAAEEVPEKFVPAVEEGVRGSVDAGVLAGYPLVDIDISLVKGMHIEVDSSELAYKIAASIGLREAIRGASPAILEPIMDVQVVVPEEFMGEVVGDINRRQGKIAGMNSRETAQVVDANVPLRQMFGYTTDLRTATQGRGNYTMQFAYFDFVPEQIAKMIVG